MKAEEYRKMGEDELSRELEGLRKSLFELRTKSVTDVVEKHHQIRAARRNIARVLTVLREKKGAPPLGVPLQEGRDAEKQP